MEKIMVTRSSMPTLEEYVDEIRSIWDTHWLTNMGEKHNRLEAELQKYLKVPNVSLFTNGHMALELGDRKSTRLNSSHLARSRMPSSA